MNQDSRSALFFRPVIAAATLIPLAYATAQSVPDPASQTAATVKPLRDEATTTKIVIKGSVNDFDARRHDTATKIVVTQEEILRHGDSRLSDVLNRLPGVTVGGGIRLRGLGNGYTQILLNGDPMPPGFSLESVTPDLIERIEIMRAATAEYSTQAVAGTINIVLKKIVQKGQRELKIGMLYDTDPGVFANFQISDKKGKISYSVAGGILRGKYGYISTVEEKGVDPFGQIASMRIEQRDFAVRLLGINLAPRVNWTVSESDSLSWQSFFNYNRNRVQEARDTQVMAGGLSPLAGAEGVSSVVGVQARSDLNWVRKLAAGAKLDMKLGANFTQQENDGTTNSVDFADRLALLAINDTTNRNQGVTASGKYSTRVGEHHSFVAGWDGAWNRRGERRLKLETSPTGLIPDDVDENAIATVRRLAVFAQDEWQVNPRWSVYFGLRWEGIETEAGFASQAPGQNKSTVWSPVFQTLYKLPGSKKDQLRLALSRTYKAPDTFSLLPRRVLQRENSEIRPDLVGNPELRPELASGIDLGYEHFLEGTGLVSIGGYARRISDVTQTSTRLVAGRWVSTADNVGTARTYGVEMDAKLPLRSIWKTMPQIDLRANLTRSWSSIDTVPGPDNRLGSQVPISGTLGLDYKADKGGFSMMGASFSYQGGGQVRISEEQYKYSLPRRMLDAYVLYKLDPKHQLRLSLSNVLHRQSANETIFVTPLGRWSTSYREPSFTMIRAALEMKL